MTNVLLQVGACMFCLGVLGFLAKRNLILIFLSVELMLAGASLNFIAFGKLHGDLGGQTLVLLILTVAACEAALALALIVALYRSSGCLDINLWQAIRETPPPSADLADMVFDATEQDADTYGDLPKLTAAGHDPLVRPTFLESAQPTNDPLDVDRLTLKN